jgi:hypothetical protein
MAKNDKNFTVLFYFKWKCLEDLFSFFKNNFYLGKDFKIAQNFIVLKFCK